MARNYWLPNVIIYERARPFFRPIRATNSRPGRRATVFEIRETRRCLSFARVCSSVGRRALCDLNRFRFNELSAFRPFAIIVRTLDTYVYIPISVFSRVGSYFTSFRSQKTSRRTRASSYPSPVRKIITRAHARLP